MFNNFYKLYDNATRYEFHGKSLKNCFCCWWWKQQSYQCCLDADSEGKQQIRCQTRLEGSVVITVGFEKMLCQSGAQHSLKTCPAVLRDKTSRGGCSYNEHEVTNASYTTEGCERRHPTKQLGLWVGVRKCFLPH
jgi:hypothetical protein